MGEWLWLAGAGADTRCRVPNFRYVLLRVYELPVIKMGLGQSRTIKRAMNLEATPFGGHVLPRRSSPYSLMCNVLAGCSRALYRMT